MNCSDMYINIHKNLLENLNNSLQSQHSSAISLTQAFVDDFGMWMDWIKKNYKIELFRVAILEYETCLLLALQGLYKQAFTSLRSCLEHTLFGIQLSANLLQYLNWKKNASDVFWSKLTDKDTGLFSKNYISAFFPELCEPSLLISDLVKSTYRECSEYTHGNYASCMSIDETIHYDEKSLGKFLETMDSLRYIISFSLFVRFANEIPSDELEKFRHQITEYIGHIPEVVDFLSTN